MINTIPLRILGFYSILMVLFSFGEIIVNDHTLGYRLSIFAIFAPILVYLYLSLKSLVKSKSTRILGYYSIVMTLISLGSSVLTDTTSWYWQIIGAFIYVPVLLYIYLSLKIPKA